MVLGFMLSCVLRAQAAFWLVLSSSTSLHGAISKQVLRAQILFFDSNPIGRIVTRFAKDCSILDNVIAVFIIYVISGALRTLTVIITLGIINPWLFIAIAVAVVLMIYILRRSMKPMQNSQQLDGILRGPIHSTFSMVI